MEKIQAALDVPKTEVLMEMVERKCVLRGLNPIMFEKYAGDNKTKLDPSEKMYFLDDGKTLCIPSTNVHSFLSAELTNSAPKMFEGKGWQNIAKACLSYVSITPTLIPITRNGKTIVFWKV